MPTYEIQMTHVNRVQNTTILHVEAYDKIEAAEYVNERFGYPTETAYSMHEMARPLTAYEQMIQTIDKAICDSHIYSSQLKNFAL